jgi:hypothetical protein
MRSRALTAALLVVVALVAGCGKDDKAAPPASTTTTAAAKAGAAAGIDVHVITAGAAPRRTFRLAVAPGAERRATMRMTMTIKQDLNGASGQTFASPPIDMPMIVHVDGVKGDKIDASFRYGAITVIDDGTADPKVVASLRNSGIDKLSQVTGKLRMTTRGELLDASLTKPQGLPANLNQFLDQIEPQLQNLAVPFPEEAIGSGASWSVATELTLSGIHVRNEYVYKLVQAAGDTYHLDMTIKQTAEPQKADIPGLTASIKSFLTQGTGTLSGKLTELLPLTLATKAAGDQVLEVQQGTQSGTLSQHLTIDVTLR